MLQWCSRARIGALLCSAVMLCSAMALRASDDPPSTVGPLMKLYRSGRLPAERQPTVVEMICNRGNEHDLRVVFDNVMALEAMTPELRLKAMAGLTDAALSRKVIPVGDLQGLASLIESDDAKVQLAAVRLAAACRVESAAPALRQLATSDRAAAELQRAAIAGLVSIGGEANRDALLKLSDEAPGIATRMQAAAGLIGVDLELAATQSAKVLAAATQEDDPGPLMNAFFQRKEGPDQLAHALSQQQLQIDVAKRALRYMYSVGRSDAALSDVLSAAAGVSSDDTPPTPEQVAEIVAAVELHGNAERGERIFRRADLSCMRCHSVSRAGGQVGPDLSAVGGSSPLDYVANSILNPNLAIKEQFVTRIFETSDGLQLSGVLIDRDENRIRLRDAQGNLVVIPTSDVEAEAEGPTMMPTGLTKFLTRDELLDLIRFVSELGKPGEYAVQTVPTMQRWRVMLNPPAELTSSVPHLENIRQFVLGSAEDAWASAYGKVAGKLPLAELRQGDQPTVLILRGELQVNEAGAIGVKIESTEPVQVWIDEQPVQSETEFETKLEPGKHAIILRVEVSSQSDPELRVQFHRPAESTAQFEVVGGA